MLQVVNKSIYYWQRHIQYGDFTTVDQEPGKNTAKVNGVDTPIDVTNQKVVPVIINSRTMLPIRFVTENLGCLVDWDPNAQMITITYPTG